MVVHYYWPAEWSPQAATLLLYPHNPKTFRVTVPQRSDSGCSGGDSVHDEFLAIVQAIASERAPAIVIVPPPPPPAAAKTAMAAAMDALRRLPHVQVAFLPSNDSWARDTAPTIVMAFASSCVSDSSSSLNSFDADAASSSSIIHPPPSQQNNPYLVGIDWGFNAYGGKGIKDNTGDTTGDTSDTGDTGGCYWPCDLDQKLAARICSTILHIPSMQPRVPHNHNHHRNHHIILEGGSIHTDGLGTILTTEECLLHPNRNPQFSKHEIERIILDATGGTHMIWLPYGLAHDDDTNGHIDNFCCFTSPHHLVLAWTDDSVYDADNYTRCRQALHILQHHQTVIDAQRHALTITKLYLPSPIMYTQEIIDDLQSAPAPDHTVVCPRRVGDRMAASYVNFYITNDKVIVPQFGDALYDPLAIATLQPLFPDRLVVGVRSKEILIGGGNIHCITQQVPRLHDKQRSKRTLSKPSIET